MKSEIAFDNLGIAEILSRFTLQVPLNQREYAWEADNVSDLLVDVANSMREARDAYFLGTIVLTKTTSESLEVADGQQRLATTTIIMTVIRDMFLEMDDQKRADAIESQFLFQIDIESRERKPKLSLNADDNQFFLTRILARPEERGNGPEASRRSHKLLRQAYSTVREYFVRLQGQYGKTHFDEALLQWRKYLLHPAAVIALTVPNSANAFVMFETLNDRGIKTSQADLVKNHLFEQSAKRLSEAQTYWSSLRGTIESMSEEDLIMDYLRHACCLFNGATREREIFDLIETKTKGAENAIRVLSFLSDLSKHYAAIFNPDHTLWNGYDSSVRDSIRTLNLLSVAQIRPLMMAVSHHFSQKETAAAFRRFVSWCVRFLVAGVGRGGALDKFYADLAKSVHDGEIKNLAELDATAKSFVPTDAQFQSTFETVRVRVAKLARYYLRSLEMTAAKLPNPEWVPNEDTVINLEHILPKTPSPHWPVEAHDIETHVQRLGNLVLLQATVNSDIDRESFPDKRKAYSESTFLLTRQVADTLLWGVQEIEDRQKTLAKLAVVTWPAA